MVAMKKQWLLMESMVTIEIHWFYDPWSLADFDSARALI
jgi:hypothetical protein